MLEGNQGLESHQVPHTAKSRLFLSKMSKITCPGPWGLGPLFKIEYALIIRWVENDFAKFGMGFALLGSLILGRGPIWALYYPLINALLSTSSNFPSWGGPMSLPFQFLNIVNDLAGSFSLRFLFQLSTTLNGICISIFGLITRSFFSFFYSENPLALYPRWGIDSQNCLYIMYISRVMLGIQLILQPNTYKLTWHPK